MLETINYLIDDNTWDWRQILIFTSDLLGNINVNLITIAIITTVQSNDNNYSSILDGLVRWSLWKWVYVWQSAASPLER